MNLANFCPGVRVVADHFDLPDACGEHTCANDPHPLEPTLAEGAGAEPCGLAQCQGGQFDRRRSPAPQAPEQDVTLSALRRFANAR